MMCAVRLPFFRRVLGIQYTGGVLRVATSKRQGWQRKLLKLCEKEMPAKAGLPDGTIILPGECAKTIRENLEGHRLSGSLAVLLLPPEKVYTHLFLLPPLATEQIEGILRSEIEKVLPEAYGDLLVMWHILRRSPKELEVGVAAVRHDVVRGYLETARQVGLRVERITTAPAAIACFTHAAKEAKTFLLLCLPSAKDKRPTVTLLRHRWPIDEVVLPSSATETEIATTLKEFVTEYAAKGMPVERLVFLGATTAEKRLRDIFAQTEFLHTLGPLPVESALPWLKDRNEEWGGIQAACLASDTKLSLDFLHRSQRRSRLGYLLIGSGVCIAAIVLWMLFLQ